MISTVKLLRLSLVRVSLSNVTLFCKLQHNKKNLVNVIKFNLMELSKRKVAHIFKNSISWVESVGAHNTTNHANVRNDKKIGNWTWKWDCNMRSNETATGPHSHSAINFPMKSWLCVTVDDRWRAKVHQSLVLWRIAMANDANKKKGNAPIQFSKCFDPVQINTVLIILFGSGSVSVFRIFSSAVSIFFFIQWVLLFFILLCIRWS